MKAPSRPLLGILLGLLTACNLCPPTATTAQVSGTVIYPPATGTAHFSAEVNGVSVVIASGLVSASGAYSVTLPARPPLPVGGNTSGLVNPVQALTGEFSSMQCSGQPTFSDPQARTVMLNAGNYEVGGQNIATLTPVINVLGASLDLTPHTVAQRVYTYTDRNLTLSGTLNCSFSLRDGSTLRGPLTVGGGMNTGWNILETRAVFDASGLQVVVTATPTLSSLDWRYVPNP